MPCPRQLLCCEVQLSIHPHQRSPAAVALLPVHTPLLFILSLKFYCNEVFRVEETVIAMAKTVRRSLNRRHSVCLLWKSMSVLWPHFNAFKCHFPHKNCWVASVYEIKKEWSPRLIPLASVKLIREEVAAHLKTGSLDTLQLQFQGTCSRLFGCCSTVGVW